MSNETYVVRSRRVDGHAASRYHDAEGTVVGSTLGAAPRFKKAKAHRVVESVKLADGRLVEALDALPGFVAGPPAAVKE